MLHAHPRIAMPPETRFVLAAYRARNGYGDLRVEANRQALARAITGDRKTLFYDLGLDAQEVVAEITGGPPTIGSVFGTIFRAYARRFGKPRWGDKRPGYYDCIPGLLRMFPDAQIVHLIRDGRDCVASLKSMPWSCQDIYEAISTWTEAIDSSRRAAQWLPPDAYVEVRYERLVADPDGQLRALCDFLGEDYDPAMTEPHKVADAIPERKTWHADNRRPVTTALSGSWQDRLAPWEVSLCELVMGRRLREFGYERSGAPKLSAVHLARYTRVAALRRGAAAKRVVTDRVERARESGPVEYLL
jgi:hypothetical protein